MRYYFIPDEGPIPAWVVIALGVLLVLLGVILVPSGRGGFGTATGRVVEHRPGKRPTIVEFSPTEKAKPVQFKSGRQLAVGAEVAVSFSLADPRNAHVITKAERRGTQPLGIACLVIGAIIITLGIVGATR